MLRYFYIIVCIQVCFCSVYVDNNDYEVLDRRIRCKTTKLNKKQTRSPKSRLVQFDVQKFMRTPDSVEEEDHTIYGYRSKKRPNRLVTANHENSAEPLKRTSPKRKLDNVHMQSSGHKFQNPRHYNYPSEALDDKDVVKMSPDHKKAAVSYNTKVTDRRLANHPEKKCSFKHMKIPFFSRNKATVKSKRHKKRRIFCFNCGNKKTTTVVPPFTADSLDTKSDDFHTVSSTIPTTDIKARAKLSRINKRAYDKLCPKCIRELIMGLRRKTTKKSLESTPKPKTDKTTTKKRTMKQKADLSDSFHGGSYEASERLKRNENEEQERERRLKELEEVEKKIENVHVAGPTFQRSFH